MNITNSTKETLQITSWTSSGKSNHWVHWPTSLAPGASETVSNYSAGDAQIDLQFTAQTSKTVFSLHGETPLVGSNQASGSAPTGNSYTVVTTNAKGYNPTYTYNMGAGHTFSFTSHTETYTVPPGITQLKVAAIGGAGNSSETFDHEPNGAEVNGTLAVTPGEVLTVGVGGQGNTTTKSVAGGWGLTNGSDN